jgi:hypothetical protein
MVSIERRSMREITPDLQQKIRNLELELPDDKYIYQAFPLDHPHGIYDHVDSHFLTVKMHSMTGSFNVQWEIVRRDNTLNHIVARRLKSSNL